MKVGRIEKLILQVWNINDQYLTWREKKKRFLKQIPVPFLNLTEEKKSRDKTALKVEHPPVGHPWWQQVSGSVPREKVKMTLEMETHREACTLPSLGLRGPKTSGENVKMYTSS